LKASGAGARLRYGALPVAAALDGLDEAARRRAALGGGDVYELCFTAARADRARVLKAGAASGAAVTRVGEIVPGAGLAVLDGQGQFMSGLPGGFDHFKS
jgi:thiamine-monophosphate kinase